MKGMNKLQALVAGASLVVSTSAFAGILPHWQGTDFYLQNTALFYLDYLDTDVTEDVYIECWLDTDAAGRIGGTGEMVAYIGDTHADLVGQVTGTITGRGPGYPPKLTLSMTAKGNTDVDGSAYLVTGSAKFTGTSLRLEGVEYVPGYFYTNFYSVGNFSGTLTPKIPGVAAIKINKPGEVLIYTERQDGDPYFEIEWLDLGGGKIYGIMWDSDFYIYGNDGDDIWLQWIVNGSYNTKTGAFKMAATGMGLGKGASLTATGYIEYDDTDELFYYDGVKVTGKFMGQKIDCNADAYDWND